MNHWLEFLFFLSLLIIGSIFLGYFMNLTLLRKEEKNIPILTKLENFAYKIISINPNEEMDWKTYAKSLFFFNILGFIILLFLELIQNLLPYNPQNFPNIEMSEAINIAVSFTTNTNWQVYAGETTMSYLTQMLGLTVQNFLSAATGISVLLALIRGITRKTTQTIGNYWVDLTRSIIYLLLPLSIFLAVVLVSQGVIQNFNNYQQVTTIIGESQLIPQGPVASQIAIKQLGSNGGGFFNANSAHPYENPTPLSNFLEIYAMLLIPAACVWMYGFYIQSKKQVLVIFSVIMFFWFASLMISFMAENEINPLTGFSFYEGKETRFGLDNTVLWTISQSSTSNGSVNSSISSSSPLTSGVALINMLITANFGAIGVGLCGMIIFILFAVFLAGLMVGRTPEYLGKKIEKNEIQWVMFSLLIKSGLILLGAGMIIIVPSTLNNLNYLGPHGLTGIFYEIASLASNNGSTFDSLKMNPILNLVFACIMLLARLSILLPTLAIAGSLATKRIIVPSLGTFVTDGPLFGILLIFIILLVGGITFFPAISLGPITEYLIMNQKRTF